MQKVRVVIMAWRDILLEVLLGVSSVSVLVARVTTRVPKRDGHLLHYVTGELLSPGPYCEFEIVAFCLAVTRIVYCTLNCRLLWPRMEPAACGFVVTSSTHER